MASEDSALDILWIATPHLNFPSVSVAKRYARMPICGLFRAPLGHFPLGGNFSDRLNRNNPVVKAASSAA
jgi:hypothetical protein